ncbi:hypothetical protein LCGC14_3069050, partial [marine sediment metagenome]
VSIGNNSYLHYLITLLIIFLCVTVQTPFRMAISARLTMELCLVQAEKSSSQSRLVKDLFRSFPIAFSGANLNQI